MVFAGREDVVEKGREDREVGNGDMFDDWDCRRAS